MNKKVTTSLMLFFSISIFNLSYSQDQKAKNKGVNYIQKPSEKISNTYSKYKKDQVTPLIQPIVTLGGISYPDPEKNFQQPISLKVAGDINKDGLQDFYYSLRTADEITEELDDYIYKTFFIYGNSSGLDIDDDFVAKTEFPLVLIEDLNNDGIREVLNNSKILTDKSGGNYTDLEEIGISIPSSSTIKVESAGDFNDDGFNDLFIYDINNPSSLNFKFAIVFGNQNIENMSIVEYHDLDFNEDGARRKSMILANVDQDSEMEVLQLANTNSSSNMLNLTVYDIISPDSFYVKQSIELIESFFFTSAEMLALDLNNDSQQELIFIDRNTVYLYENKGTNEEMFESDPDFEISGTQVSKLGDFNNDGFQDLLIDGNEISVVFGNSMNNYLASTISSSPGEKGIGIIKNSRKYVSNIGDINGDDIDDLIHEYQTDDKYGYKVFYGNGDENLSSDENISYMIPTLDLQHPDFTFNAGDFNGDGIDDFGITYNAQGATNSSNSKTEIYFGGNLSEITSPDIILSHADGLSQSPPTSGDFNGDGFSDIVINYKNNDVGMHIYYGGLTPDNQKDYSMSVSSDMISTFGPPSNGFEVLANIGDINEDGIEDIGFSTPVNQNTTFILFGGSELSVTPDLEIPFYAASMIAVGNFDDTDANYIALANSFIGFDTKIRVFKSFNSDSEESFDTTPAYILQGPNNQDIRNLYYGISMASGDFNGDGFSDIAASTLDHFLLSDPSQGTEAIFITLGGTQPDGVIDHSFVLKVEDFAGTDQTLQNTEFLTNLLGELVTVPDQNGDGSDELMVGTNPNYFGRNALTNAVVFYGNEDITKVTSEATFILRAPNQNVGLGTQNNNLYVQNGRSAVGNFNGTKKNEFILAQSNDANFVKDPAYIFSSDNLSVSAEEEIEQISEYKLSQNYPNPFNPSTNISYSIPQTSDVSLKIYDVTGRLVSTLVNKRQASGTYDVSLNASSWASGIYFYRIVAGDYIKTRKFTLIK